MPTIEVSERSKSDANTRMVYVGVGVVVSL